MVCNSKFYNWSEENMGKQFCCKGNEGDHGHTANRVMEFAKIRFAQSTNKYYLKDQRRKSKSLRTIPVSELQQTYMWFLKMELNKIYDTVI